MMLYQQNPISPSGQVTYPRQRIGILFTDPLVTEDFVKAVIQSVVISIATEAVMRMVFK